MVRIRFISRALKEGGAKSRSPALRDDMREAQYVSAGQPDPK